MTRELPDLVVVSCIIEKGQGEVLICRESGGAGGCLWEFPTGVAEGHESPEAAARRVAASRVGLVVDIHTGQPPFAGEYCGRPATYRFFLALVLSGEASGSGYDEVRWVRRGQLCEYDFGAAFQPIVAWYVG